MKKIIVELLEQYEKDMDMPQFAIQYYTDEYIISKHYGFIKWLIDNDRIDFSRGGKYSEKSIEEFDWLLRDDIDWLIMLLAIQDEPIEFLISILK